MTAVLAAPSVAPPGPASVLSKSDQCMQAPKVVVSPASSPVSSQLVSQNWASVAAGVPPLGPQGYHGGVVSKEYTPLGVHTSGLLTVGAQASGGGSLVPNRAKEEVSIIGLEQGLHLPLSRGRHLAKMWRVLNHKEDPGKQLGVQVKLC